MWAPQFEATPSSFGSFGSVVFATLSQVDQVRDWKTFLEDINVHVTGIAGPSAAHEFVFQRFEGY
jgi:hypothetical protein